MRTTKKQPHKHLSTQVAALLHYFGDKQGSDRGGRQKLASLMGVNYNSVVGWQTGRQVPSDDHHATLTLLFRLICRVVKKGNGILVWRCGNVVWTATPRRDDQRVTMQFPLDDGRILAVCPLPWNELLPESTL